MTMLSPEQEEIIEKVRKLLALSKSANPHESALALAKAEDLLERHRLDMTAIEMVTGQKEQIIEDDDPLFDSEKITKWEASLAHGISYLYGCTTIRVGGKVIKIIGRASDIMFVRYFVSYVTLEFFRLSKDAFYKKRKDYKDSWFLGATEEVLKRLKEAKAIVQQTANQFAVMTVNNRYNEAQKKLDELYPQATFNKLNAPDKFNADAYYLGQQAGNKIKLTQDKSLLEQSRPSIS